MPERLAEVFDLLNRFTERDQVRKVSGTERAATTTFAGFFSRQIYFDAHIQERLAFFRDPRQQLAEPRYQAARFAQSEYSDLFGLVVAVHW